MEIRWHGRGGQGVVTASYILAKGLIEKGIKALHFPEFGPERRGAPVKAYTKIGRDDRIPIKNPDIIVVIDPGLVKEKEIVCEGEKENTIYVLNIVNEEDLELYKEKKVYYINAHEIAIKTIGKPFYNIPMLGAVIKVLNLELEPFENIVLERFGEKNVLALREGYKNAKST